MAIDTTCGQTLFVPKVGKETATMAAIAMMVTNSFMVAWQRGLVWELMRGGKWFVLRCVVAFVVFEG